VKRELDEQYIGSQSVVFSLLAKHLEERFRNSVEENGYFFRGT